MTYLEIKVKQFNFKWKLLDCTTYKYPYQIRDMINGIVMGFEFNQNLLDKQLGLLFGNLSKKFLKKRSVDIVVSHGQTVKHIDNVLSIQLGDPMQIFNMLNVPIVSNVRSADISVGGNGAPLMPFLDWLLFKDLKKEIISLNIGGISNISFIPISGERDKVLGFDTGPGMSLIDEACNYFYDSRMDEDAKYSKSGVINYDILKVLMSNNYLNKKPPKSTGRYEFGYNMFEKIYKAFKDVLPNDIIRTLCLFTAKSIIHNLDKFINYSCSKTCLIISGGGAKHPILIEDIKRECKIKKILLSNNIGINSDFKESLLMAVLGVASLKKIPSNMPSVTGAKKKVVLGELTIRKN